jgi:hypothetical protein
MVRGIQHLVFQQFEMKYPSFNLKCKKCGGLKYIGDEYHALDRMWVDITCIQCSHSVDIEVEKLQKFLSKLKKVSNVNK